MSLFFKKISKRTAIRLKTLTQITSVRMLLFCFDIADEKFLFSKCYCGSLLILFLWRNDILQWRWHGFATQCYDLSTLLKFFRSEFTHLENGTKSPWLCCDYGAKRGNAHLSAQHSVHTQIPSQCL